MKINIMRRRIFYHILAVLATIVSVSSIQDAPGRLHECSRLCIPGATSKICSYQFFVGKAIGTDNDGIFMKRVINGTSPGPPIEVCLGDTLVVIVENGLSSEELSFHWHGLRQKGSPHMDGVSMISQCPIMPFTSFRYEIKPESIGTYFYHAHSVRQQGDGLYGSLSVRGPLNDPTIERILLISARPSSSLSELVYLDPPVPKALILNGQTRDVKIKVKSGQKYLLRVINANVFNCPVSFFVAQHNVDIIASDGHSVEPGSSAERIIVFPGERFDLAIDANQTPGRYLVAVQGLEDCRDLIHEASLNYYEDTSYKSMIRADQLYLDSHDNKPFKHCREKSGETKIVCSLHLKGNLQNNVVSSNLAEGEEENEEIATYYVPFDINSYDNIHDGMTDYSFNIYEFSYYPSFLSTRANATRIGQINRMTFEYPSSPILSQPEAIPDDTLCTIEERAKLCQTDEKYFCQCTQILQLPAWKTVDIVLIDEGSGADNFSHTFHVHGYDVAIVGMGQFDRPIRRAEIVELNDKGLLRRDAIAQYPLLKNTFVVPNKGYLVLRFHTDNIGYWLWESRSTGLYADGPPMQFVMLVGNRENLPIVPIDFPTCGSHKGPVSIFEDSD